MVASTASPPPSGRRKPPTPTAAPAESLPAKTAATTGPHPDPQVSTGQHQDTGSDQPGPPRRTRATRTAMGALLALVALAVALVILSPVALSSRDLLGWASAPTGLDLPHAWPVLVIVSLDAGAIVCVLMCVLCTWLGERPGIFAVMIWVFALGSAFANWRHATSPAAPPDAVWFFPAMSLLGPGILDVVLYRVRGWLKEDTSRTGSTTQQRNADTGAAGSAGGEVSWQRWVPGLGSFSDTFGAHRTRLLVPGLTSLTEAITAYHHLCPDGSIRVARAVRRKHLIDLRAHALRSLTPPPDPPSGVTGASVLWPVDLLSRIPAKDEPYQRWRSAWADLQAADTAAQKNGSPHQHADASARNAITARYRIGARTLQFIRSAGELGLLDSPIPTAVRLARLAQDHESGDVRPPQPHPQ